MTVGDRDEELVRAALADGREEELRDSPSFASVVGRSAPRMQWQRSSVIKLAAAGIVVVVAGATYAARTTREPRLSVPSEVVALGTWRPATDFLLAMPTDLLRAPPVLGASMIDRVRGQ